MVGAVSDTLLGPEGSDDTCRLELAWPSLGVWLARVVCVGWFFWLWALPRSRAALVVGVGCRLYFENFTVDASIFVVSSF